MKKTLNTASNNIRCSFEAVFLAISKPGSVRLLNQPPPVPRGLENSCGSDDNNKTF